jgi:TRAP-type C4-dicarboxylate transport system permease small subunit
MRSALNRVYQGSGLLAGFFLVMVAVLSISQIVGRLLGFAAVTGDEFGGYCMAASSFLGLAWTLRANEHIRVTLLTAYLRRGGRRVLELSCLVIAAGLIGFFTFWAAEMVLTSYRLDDISQGLVPIKLWIPQLGMALGLAILSIAIIDDLLLVLRGGQASYENAGPAGDSPGFER